MNATEEEKLVANLRSLETNRLINFLISKDVGTLVTYAELQEIIKRDPRKSGRGYVVSARKWLEREHGIVFGTVPMKGLKRLDPDEVVWVAHDYMTRAKTASSRAVTLASIAPDKHISNRNKAVKENITAMSSLISYIATVQSKSNSKPLPKLANGDYNIPLFIKKLITS